MKVSIRRSGVVVLALAIALAGPRFGAGNAWAQIAQTVTGGSSSGAANGAYTTPVGTNRSGDQDAIVVKGDGNTLYDDPTNTTVYYDDIRNGDTLTVTGGNAFNPAAAAPFVNGLWSGGVAGWIGDFDSSNAVFRAGAITVQSGQAYDAAAFGGVQSIAGHSGGSANIGFNGSLFTNDVTTVAVGNGIWASGAGNIGASGNVTLSVAGDYLNDLAGAVDALVITGGNAGDGHTLGGDGGGLGDVSVTISGRTTILDGGVNANNNATGANVTFNRLNGGDSGIGPNSGNGGDGGNTTVTFGGETTIGGNFSMEAGNGGVSLGGGNGGKGGNSVLTHNGNLTVNGTNIGGSAYNLETGLGGNVGNATIGATGNGGAGGSIIANYAGSVTIKEQVALKTALGGGNVFLNGIGAGGHGGHLTTSYGGLYSSEAGETITTGDGGRTLDAGNGGKGGDINEKYATGLAIGLETNTSSGGPVLSIITGNGGRSGMFDANRGDPTSVAPAYSSTGQGGNGGDYTANVTGAAQVYGLVAMTTGAGGHGSDEANAGTVAGNGGRGGDLSYDVTGTLDIRDDASTLNGTFNVATGNGGWGGTGAKALTGTGGRGGDFTLAVSGSTTVANSSLFVAGIGGNSGSTEGGRGGDITVSFGTGLTRTQAVLAAGNTADGADFFNHSAGAGGITDNSGVGGRGGNLTETYYGRADYDTNTVAISAGAGGNAVQNSTENGVGGAGGNATLYYMSDIDASGASVDFTAGAGGNVTGASKSAGHGGAGGTFTAIVDGDLLGTGAATNFTIAAGNGGDSLAGSAASGKAGVGGDATLSVARDLSVTGATGGQAGHGGGDGTGVNTAPAAIGMAGRGGDLLVDVGRIYRSGLGTAYAAGHAGAASGSVDGADGGNVTLNVGTFQVEGAGTFTAGNAGQGGANHTGGKGGDVNVTVHDYAAYFGQGFDITAGNTVTANTGHTGIAGNATFRANGGYVVAQNGFSLLGGDGATGSDHAAGTASFTAKSLTVTSDNGTASGRIGGTLTTAAGGTLGNQGVNPGAAQFNVTRLLTNNGTGFNLDIHRDWGNVDVRAENVAAVGEDFSINLNRNGTEGNYTVDFDNLAVFGNTHLSIFSDNTNRLFSWNKDLYAGAPVNGTNMLTVLKRDNASNVIYDQVDMSGKTVAIDVANLRDVIPAVSFDYRPQILDVNGDITQAGHGVMATAATKHALLGADNLRFGQTVKLYNLADGATIATHDGGGEIGDTYGNLADATYTLAMQADSTGKTYATLRVDNFSIRKDWVIDNSRDLTTDNDADRRSLSVPGTLTIVDNRYEGPNDIVIRVDDQKGTVGTANLWADTISVLTTNSVSRDWIEHSGRGTATTFDFTQSVAGDLNNRNVHGVAFQTLNLKSGSHTVINGDMGAIDDLAGIGNYAFGGNLIVGEAFRADHTSARLTNNTVLGVQHAIKFDRATFNLADDVPNRIAHADAWMDSGGQRYDQVGGNGVVLLEVIGGDAPIVDFKQHSVNFVQRLASINAMENLRLTYGEQGPRLTVIDVINGALSTIDGQTFAENRSATIQARSWAQQGFIEGVWDITYGNHDPNDGIADWGQNDSVIGEFKGLAADLGKSALQARTAGEQLVNQGQDLIVDTMGNAMPIGAYNPATGIQPMAFIAMIGGHRSVDTGSRVSGNGFSLVAGPGISIDSNYGRSAAAVVLEYGLGDFNLDNNFAWRGAFNGTAETHYYGGAILARHENWCGVYGEASFRAGVVDTDYKGSHSATDFSTDAMYFGGHVGLGYKMDAWQDGLVDIYAKGLFTQMTSDSADNSANEHLKFDSSTSVRFRLGARLSHTFMPELSGYVGAAWEYEFDGKQKGTVNMIGSNNVVGIPAIDTQGHTGMGEIGIQWQANDRLSVGAAFQGAFGQRDGYGGMARVSYTW